MKKLEVKRERRYLVGQMNIGIHPTAVVSGSARIGAGVSIGPFAIIHENCTIGKNSKIGAFAELGIQSAGSKNSKLEIGPDSNIRSRTTIYEGSTFGANLETGHNVVIRENTSAGENLRVGSFSDLQGDLVIGDFARLHSSVHLGKGTKLGNFVWIFPYVVTTNDPLPPSSVFRPCLIEDYVVIATGSVLLPGVKIGRDSVIAANSTVTRDVEPYSLVIGSPGKKVKDVREISLKDDEGEYSYPWRNHFNRGFPTRVLDMWEKEI